MQYPNQAGDRNFRKKQKQLNPSSTDVKLGQAHTFAGSRSNGERARDGDKKREDTR